MSTFNPGATYRIQFCKSFGFADFEKIIPYLQKLGINTVYASPIFKAVPGSVHGYDVTDPHTINPEIGTIEQLRKISKQLKASGMAWMQDIVPNHMALHKDNTRLQDVLQYGQKSAYASYFDIDWEHPDMNGRMMLPVLGADLTHELRDGNIKLSLKDKGVVIEYFDNIMPLSPESVAALKLSGAHAKTVVDSINADPSALQKLLEMQAYALTHWQITDKQINYRRFFTINGLIGLNINRPEVFADYHQLIKQLCEEGIFQALRVDHVDGIADATDYLYQLRQLVGNEMYICVEKILEAGEHLPNAWPIEGATGYEFLSAVNNLFTNKKYAKKWDRFYRSKTKQQQTPEQIALEKKRLILTTSMGGESALLTRLAQKILPDTFSVNDIKSAIEGFLVACPVYKYYANALPLSRSEQKKIAGVISGAERENLITEKQKEILQLLFFPDFSSVDTADALAFYRRCMQFTGPLMAKGVEDTMMYTYNNFIAHNEVGDSPWAFGISHSEFHRFMQTRAEQTPLALNGTATHDTKRGEDARARLNVLSDASDAWFAHLEKWISGNKQFTKKNLPNFNDQYLIYQSLMGSFPVDAQPDGEYTERVKAFITKALREAKTNTTWSQPNEDYEAGVIAFVEAILSDEHFIKDFERFFKTINDAGILNSLCQLVLKCTCPGIPDIYQGTELWDFSMVDPDNRRAVDYALRADLEAQNSKPEELNLSLLQTAWDERYTGRIKMLHLQTLLQLRMQNPELFAHGKYVPLAVTGKYKKNVLAFARQLGRSYVVTAIGLNCHEIALEQGCNLTAINWHGTAIELPDTDLAWTDVFSRDGHEHKTSCKVADLFRLLPISVLHANRAENPRGAGILMPTFSLPNRFGIGDFGPSSQRFARQLHDAGQKYWQLLPLNPLLASSNYSPYSSNSSMACNPAFVSPELLQNEGLIDEETLASYISEDADTVDYERCIKQKYALLDIAYRTVKSRGNTKLKVAFDAFKRKQAYWLDDYAMYIALTKKHDDACWTDWPTEFKTRDAAALKAFAAAEAEKIEEVKFYQFIADRHLQSLRNLCRQEGVSLIGDIPFYMSNNAADVWTHRELFNLDDAGKPALVAGVPPDYFSETGQLWGMPTYNWEQLRAQNYQWWIDRLQRNMEQFDLVRIDHFRALQAFWEVKSGEPTAVNGTWQTGPGMAFFTRLKEVFGELPFIAEDLGYEMDDVYRLREQTGLPGMKVLQFAWGPNMPESVDTPHNYTTNTVVYTGTHDNNTTLGWFKKETTEDDRKRLENYAGKRVNESNVAETLIRLAFASVSKIAVIPFQDLINADETQRTNTPGLADGNWLIRFKPEMFQEQLFKKLRSLTQFYNRS